MPFLNKCNVWAIVEAGKSREEDSGEKENYGIDIEEGATKFIQRINQSYQTSDESGAFLNYKTC